MIFDALTNAALYASLSPRMAIGLKSLTTDLPQREAGRYELAGDDVFAMVQTYDTKPRSAGKWEAHHRYIDIQYIVAGEEVMGVAPLSTLKEKTPFDPAKDVGFYDGAGQFFTMHAGEFMILYPHDAHMPQIAPNQPAFVRKVVVKVAM